MNGIRAHHAVVIALVAVLLASATTPALAASKSDVAAHRSAAEQARAKAAEQARLAQKLQGQTAVLGQKVDALQADADQLDPAVRSAQAHAAQIRSQIDRLRSRIASQTSAIEVAQGEVERERGLLGDRVVATYRQGDYYFLDVLLGAQDFRDLVARTELVAQVLSANSNAARRLRRSQTALEYQRHELERNMTDLAAKRKEADAVATQIASLQGERQAKADAQQSVLDSKSAQLAASKASARRLLAIAESEEAASERIAAELARHKGSGAYHGSMAWPVPGHHTISSPFGYRFHPILKRRILHAGIDISGNGSSGAPIVAAGGGKVIAAGPRGGYGNVVMIDHGNGVVTVYGHQMSGGIKVSVGQRVKRGQRIGTLGSTGMSTGPHCHFEVRVNGSAVDPMRYL